MIDKLEVHWPSGLVQRFSDVKSRQIVTIREGEDNLLSSPVHGVGLKR